jgi:hypothetical protein
MEQAPGSPITAYQRMQVIAGLKNANRGEFARHAGAVVIAVVYLELMLLLPRSPMILNKIPWHTFTIYSSILLSIGALYLVLAGWMVIGISRLMRRHAAPVFADTGLVAYVLGLPTDSAAFRGWHIAWLVGEWLTRKQDQYCLRRRIKAMHARFGAWSKHFGCPPEPWAVRLAVYTAVCAPVCYVGLLKYSAPQLSNTNLLVTVVGFYILIGLMISIFIGRRVGLRNALIDYFTAEAARGDAMVTEDGASGG